MSETPENLRAEWMKTYMQSFKTKKRGYVVDKCKRGLFRLTEDMKLEILSDYRTYGKSGSDIIKDLTKPGRIMFNQKIK